MEIKMVKIADIVPYENNPRHNADAVQPVAESIKRYGFKVPMILDRENVIVTGHTRYEAAQVLGMTEVPVIYADDLTEEQVREFRLVDNKTAEIADWDFAKLEEELAELDFGDFDFGFDVSDDLTEDAEAVEDEYDAEPPKEPKAKLGDLYQLGNHRLICGDSTDSAVIDRLLDGGKAEMSFTSPPYGVELDYNSYVDTFENTKKLINHVLPVICDHTINYVVLNWGDIVSGKDINHTIQHSQFSWLPVYDDIMRQNGWYIWAERIWKKVHARCSGVWSASSNIPVSDWEYIFTWARDNPTYNVRGGGSHFGVIDSAETSQADTLSKHPGAFPVYVAGKVIEIHTKKADSVLDVFGGSGTTMIACEQLHRKCYMCELDPVYVDVIIDRWEKLTGNKAVLLS